MDLDVTSLHHRRSVHRWERMSVGDLIERVTWSRPDKLAIIGRPVDPERYRDRVHDLLRQFQSMEASGFEPAGGFRVYLNTPSGELPATAYAIELMEIYGPPRGLDFSIQDSNRLIQILVAKKETLAIFKPFLLFLQLLQTTE